LSSTDCAYPGTCLLMISTSGAITRVDLRMFLPFPIRLRLRAIAYRSQPPVRRVIGLLPNVHDLQWRSASPCRRRREPQGEQGIRRPVHADDDPADTVGRRRTADDDDRPAAVLGACLAHRAQDETGEGASASRADHQQPVVARLVDQGFGGVAVHHPGADGHLVVVATLDHGFHRGGELVGKGTFQLPDRLHRGQPLRLLRLPRVRPRGDDVQRKPAPMGLLEGPSHGLRRRARPVRSHHDGPCRNGVGCVRHGPHATGCRPPSGRSRTADCALPCSTPVTEVLVHAAPVLQGAGQHGLADPLAPGR
jgi:hypothetical protein